MLDAPFAVSAPHSGTHSDASGCARRGRTVKRPEVVIANSVADEHAKSYLALHIGERGPVCVTGTSLPSAEVLMPRTKAAARPAWRPTLLLDSFCEETPKMINKQHRWHHAAAACVGHALWTMSAGGGTLAPPAGQCGARCHASCVSPYVTTAHGMRTCGPRRQGHRMQGLARATRHAQSGCGAIQHGGPRAVKGGEAFATPGTAWWLFRQFRHTMFPCARLYGGHRVTSREWGRQVSSDNSWLLVTLPFGYAHRSRPTGSCVVWCSAIGGAAP